MMGGSNFVVRLRGLPWATSPEEITHFFRECQIDGGDKGIHFLFSREGRPTGEAFVELASEEDVTHALAQNNEHIGSRYIEVFRVDKSEMEWTLKRAGANAEQSTSEAVLKLRGLPFGCSKEEIAQFFTGMQIVPNGILLPEDRQGRSTGEAFVQFASPDIATKALEKHRERIGHRYIEIFKSSMNEANSAGGGMRDIRPLMGGGMRPSPYDRGDRMMGMGYGKGRGRNIKGFFDDDPDDFGFGGNMGFGMRNRRGGMGGMRGAGPDMNMMGRRNAQPGSDYISKTGHAVHMRGLPYQALERDIFEFFSPLQPVRVDFEFGDNGRPAGTANVDFATHQEAVEAMKKHRSNMLHRYIELFLNSDPNSEGGAGGRGGGGGGGFGNGFGGGKGFNDSVEQAFNQLANSGFGFNNQMGFGGNNAYNNANQGFGGGNYGGQNQGFGGQDNQGFGGQDNQGFGNQMGSGGGANDYNTQGGAGFGGQGGYGGDMSGYNQGGQRGFGGDMGNYGQGGGMSNFNMSGGFGDGMATGRMGNNSYTTY